MTRPERLLAVVGVSVIASAVLLVMYVRQSNPADAQAAGCSGQRSRLSQTLDQIRFSGAAAHSVSAALADTTKTRNQYLHMIAATRHQLAALHLSPHELDHIQQDLGQASWILNAQDGSLEQAQAILAQEQHELASAMPLVNEASRDLSDEDCPALSLTMTRSGWPKDRLLGELADVARINSQISDKLDSALTFILQAQRNVRYSIAAK